jgi:hypothetical protein
VGVFKCVIYDNANYYAVFLYNKHFANATKALPLLLTGDQLNEYVAPVL